MTRRRRLLLVSGVLALIAVAGYMALWLTAPRFRISEESAKLIKKGMTQAEVEAVLGVPPGDYSVTHRGNQTIHHFNEIGLTGDPWRDKLPLGYQRKRWLSEGWGIDVLFDPGGNVEGLRNIIAVGKTEVSLLARIRRWLRPPQRVLQGNQNDRLKSIASPSPRKAAMKWTWRHEATSQSLSRYPQCGHSNLSYGTSLLHLKHFQLFGTQCANRNRRRVHRPMPILDGKHGNYRILGRRAAWKVEPELIHTNAFGHSLETTCIFDGIGS